MSILGQFGLWLLGLTIGGTLMAGLMSVRDKPLGVVRRSPSRRRLHPLKAHLSQIERIDTHVDHANWVALVYEIIEAFGQQRPLPTIRLFNEAPHHFPHRITGES